MPHLRNKLIKVLVAQPDLNPYQRSLYSELEKFGIKFDIKFLTPLDYFKSENKCYNLYHLHWLHRFYESKYRIYSYFKAVLFISFLRKAKRKGIKIFITVHNILPHEIKFTTIEAFVQLQIKKTADAMIFHDINAKREYVKLFGDGRAKSFVINHGIYNESLIPMPDKIKARKYFGIKTHATCILFLGKASKRKGYDLAIKTAREINSPTIYFIFAGEDCNKSDFNGVEYCTVVEHRIPSYELAVIFAATDYVMLPYRKITTSGLANLSIGYGKPFLCSDLNYLKDLCSKGFGIAYDIYDPMDFKEKLLKAPKMINPINYMKNREAYLKSNSWENCAHQTYEAYMQVIANTNLNHR